MVYWNIRLESNRYVGGCLVGDDLSDSDGEGDDGGGGAGGYF